MAALPELIVRPQRPLIHTRNGAFIHSVTVVLSTDPTNLHILWYCGIEFTEYFQLQYRLFNLMKCPRPVGLECQGHHLLNLTCDTHILVPPSLPPSDVLIIEWVPVNKTFVSHTEEVLRGGCSECTPSTYFQKREYIPENVPTESESYYIIFIYTSVKFWSCLPFHCQILLMTHEIEFDQMC